MLNFGNAKKLCLFCLMRQDNIHGFTSADQDWIRLTIFKNFADQDWIGLNFCGSGLDSDWKISQSSHLWWLGCFLISIWQHWTGFALVNSLRVCVLSYYNIFLRKTNSLTVYWIAIHCCAHSVDIQFIRDGCWWGCLWCFESC